MSSGDFLRKEAVTPLTEHYIMAGAPGSISTNCETILAAARECFIRAATPTPADAQALHLRFWVDPRGTTGPPWPGPFCRGVDQLVYAGFDSQCSILADLRRRRAMGRFSPAMGADRKYWKTVIFPTLISVMAGTVGITELHCGCVSREGRGLLLVGRSGAGKSTLALALAQAGFAYLTDDRTYISSCKDRITAWGLPTALKLRPDAVGWFRELEGLTRDSATNRAKDLRIDPAHDLGIERLQRCEPKGLVFLKRQEYPTFELNCMSRAEAAAQLEEDLIAEAPDVTARQNGMIANLVALPCWRLGYGGTPMAVAQEFSRRLW